MTTMAKFIYERNEDEQFTEAERIEFTVSDEMDIYQFHTMCIRMAHALGYQQGSITRAFGEEKDNPLFDESEKEMKQLLQEYDRRKKRS